MTPAGGKIGVGDGVGGVTGDCRKNNERTWLAMASVSSIKRNGDWPFDKHNNVLTR